MHFISNILKRLADFSLGFYERNTKNIKKNFTVLLRTFFLTIFTVLSLIKQIQQIKNDESVLFFFILLIT